MSRRLALAAAALVLVAGLWAWAAGSDGGEAPVAVEVRAVVVGRDGAVSHDAVVLAGTPLDALRALAQRDGFDVEVEEQSWIGRGCTAHYVVAIDGEGESATGGWNYYVRPAGGDWEWRSSGAGCLALHEGEQVEWCWVEGDVCQRHAP